MASARRFSASGRTFQASVSTAPALRNIDANAARRQFHGQMARQSLQRSLGRTHCRIARLKAQGAPGTDRHQAGTLGQLRQKTLGHLEKGPDIQTKREVEMPPVKLLDGAMNPGRGTIGPIRKVAAPVPGAIGPTAPNPGRWSDRRDTA